MIWMHSREIMGITDATDPKQQAQLLEGSPLLHTRKIKSAVLLQESTRMAGDAGGMIATLNALRRAGVPSQMFVYDDGHVFAKPGNRADDITRSLEWIDHWVRGVRYPNGERAREYDTWKSAPGTKRVAMPD